MRKLMVVAALVFCVLHLPSCGGNDTIDPPTRHIFTPADYGATRSVVVGEVAVLALPANPSTGYSWHRAWTPKAALQLTESYYTPDTPQLDGSGGTQYYVFKAVRNGTVTITVQYGRWWEGGETEEPHAITLNLTE